MAGPPVKGDEPAKVRRRSWRLLRRSMLLLLALIVLCVILAGVVQAVLWSDLPRSRLELELQRTTGLRVEVGSFRTTWRGVTEVSNVTVALPLEAEPFARVPTLRVEHTPLLGLILGTIELHEARLERPNIRLRQDEQGRWNAVRAIDIVQARQAGSGGGAASRAALPRVVVRDAAIDLLGSDGQAVQVPVNVEGTPRGSLAWAFNVAVGEALALQGRLSPHGEWQHELEASLGADQVLLEALLPPQMLPVRAAVQWRGGIVRGEFGGQLRIERFELADLRVDGDAAVQGIQGGVAVRPRALHIRSAANPQAEARVISGGLLLEGALARLQRLRIEGAGTIVDLDGTWDIERETVELAARWTGAAVGPVVAHEGEIRIQGLLPETGPGHIHADVRSLGETADGSWDAGFTVSARGASWEAMIGELAAPRLIWRDAQGVIDASGTAARLENRWPLVKLDRAVLPGAQRSHVKASIDVAAMTWTVEAEATRWNLERLRGGPLDVLLRADGTGAHARVHELRVAGETFDARVMGEFDPEQPEPLSASARVAYRPPGHAGGRPASAETEPDAGAWLAQVTINGKGQPLSIRFEGEVLGRDVRIGESLVEHVSVPVSGRGTAEEAQFTSGRFDLLGGQWLLQGRYIDRTRTVALQLEADTVPLQSMARLLGAPVDLTGTGEGLVQVVVPGLDIDAMEVSGSFAVAGIDRPGLVIERGRGELVTRRGVLTLRGMEMVSGDARLTGLLEYNLRQREDVRLDVQTCAWPLGLEGVPVSAVMDGRAQLDVRLSDLTARGRVDADAAVSYEGMPLGRFSTEAKVDGRRIDISRIQGDLCSGTIEGRGIIDIDNWLGSSGVLSIVSVDAAELMHCLGADDDYAGRVTAQVRLGRSANPRAPEPMELNIRMTVEDGAFRTITFDGAEVDAFFGPKRSVLERGHVHVADGRLTLFSRLSRHEGERFAHVQMDIQYVDIDQLYQAFEPGQGPLPGRLSGQAAFGGYIAAPNRLFGEARLALADSDLATLPVISTVYNLLNLRLGPRQPTGRGEVRVRLEGDALEITRMQYFNRGADITASLRVDNIWLAGDSPISGFAVGSVRPLRELDIPFISVDRMLGALQSGAASVEMRGTLADRQIRVVPFTEISGRFIRVISGQAD